MYFPNAPCKNVPSATVSFPTMDQAVSRLNLAANSHVHSQVTPCGASLNNATLRKASPEYFGFPFSVLFHRCSTRIHSYIADAM